MSSSSTPIGAFRSSASSSGAIIRWPAVSGGGRLIVSERLGSAPASRLARATATATASEQSLDRPKAANRPASASSMRSPLPNSFARPGSRLRKSGGGREGTMAAGVGRVGPRAVPNWRRATRGDSCPYLRYEYYIMYGWYASPNPNQSQTQARAQE